MEKAGKKIKKKISFLPLLDFLTVFVVVIRKPKIQFTPLPARIFFRPMHFVSAKYIFI